MKIVGIVKEIAIILAIVIIRVMYYCFIVNANGSKGQNVALLQEKINNLPLKLDYQIHATEGPQDATNFVKTYCEQHPSDEVCFVACGGDGTIKQVASGMVSVSNKCLAVMPFGCGNDFVKYYMGRDFMNLEKLIAGEAHPIDILKVNDNYSINVCNFGFDSVVCSAANRINARGGKNGYRRGVVTGILKGRFNRIKVVVDGEQISKSKMLLCTLANNHYVGGEFLCAPRAKNDDGLIDVCHIHTMSLLSFLSLLPIYTKGGHLENKKFEDKIAYRQAKHVEVSAEKEIELCLDGEMLPGTHFDISIFPKAINFVVPQA